LQFEPFADIGIERKADQTTSVGGHEIDGFWCDLIGCNREITLVLAILIVHHDKNLALPEVLNRLRNGSKRHRESAARGGVFLPGEGSGGNAGLRIPRLGGLNRGIHRADILHTLV